MIFDNVNCDSVLVNCGSALVNCGSALVNCGSDLVNCGSTPANRGSTPVNCGSAIVIESRKSCDNKQSHRSKSTNFDAFYPGQKF